MSGTRFLLDTCVILGIYKRSPESLELALSHNINMQDAYISIINRIEVLGFSGLSTTDDKGLRQLLSQFTCLPVNGLVEQETIRLRKEHKIKLPDALILATANVHNLTLITLDKKLQKYNYPNGTSVNTEN